MPPRFRRSRTLIIIPHDGQIIVFDYLAKRAIAAETEVIHWIKAFEDWHSVDEAARSHPEYELCSVRATVERMLAFGLLIAEASDEALQQDQYDHAWQWGPLAATFHFSTQNLDFIPLEQSQQSTLAKAAVTPSPALDWHARFAGQPSIQLPPLPRESGFFETVRNRRSSRNPLPHPLNVEQLSSCLFSGLAITAHVRTPSGDLPLTPTPSGGARNPYEAFVLVQNVENLQRGIYHYSNLHHQLQLVSSALPNSPADLLAGQDWANQMPAIVFLVAVLERTMWKYAEDSAFKVVMIECGHIGQNILLAAAAQGFSACPTAALAHSLVSSHLGLDQITHTPMYAVALCHPGEYDSQILPNQLLLEAATTTD